GALHEAGNGIELTTHLLNHVEGGFSHRLHGHGGKQEGQHRTQEEADEYDRIQQVDPSRSYSGPIRSFIKASALVRKAANRASEVRMAAPIAKPLPMAAVVFPAASRMSVRRRTSFGRPAISAMPPALSETGP